MSRESKTLYEFGPFRLDADERLLLREGEAVPLTPKAFDLLLALVQRHGHLLEKDELLKKVWPDAFVEEANLSYTISQIRKALGEGEGGSRYIETVPKRGYRFVSDAREVTEEQAKSIIEEQPEQQVPTRARKGRLARAAVFFGLALVASVAGWLIISTRSTPEPRVVPITSLPGWETNASLSPDGNQVAFVSNGDIYVTLIGTGEPLRLTTQPGRELDPVWSPDGRYLAFIRAGEGSGVYLIPVLGGPERRLAEAFPQRPLIKSSLSYSPDGKFIAVADKEEAAEPFSIFLLSVETREKERLTLPPGGSLGDDSPAFSPDGGMLAFARMPSLDVSDIYVLPVLGGEPKRLTHENTNTFGLTWTPDGRAIVFSSRGKGGFLPHLWRIPATGGTPERVLVFAQDLHSPTISLQGNRLAYTQVIFEVNIWRIGLMGSAGKEAVPTRLIYSTVIETSPDYSPDGKRIAFTSLRAGMPEIWVCDSNGDNQIQLTNLSSSITGTPCWSPDGRQIAFESLSEGNKDVYLISSDGGKPRRLTLEPSEDMCPSWSRDGQWVYFGSNRSGRWQIWKVPSAGGPAVQVTREGGFEGFESPDGKFFYYTRGPRIPGIWRIPVEGGDETLVLSHHNAGRWRYWRVVDQGIYFASAEKPTGTVIEFFSFTTGKITQVAELDKGIQTGYRGLSVSPDGRWIIYASIDQSGSDIMLMENFR